MQAAAAGSGPKWQKASSLQSNDEVWTVTIMPLGPVVAFSGEGGVIKRWHIGREKWLEDLNTGKTQGIKWLSNSPENNALISADIDGNIEGRYLKENPPWTAKPFKNKDDSSSHQAEVNALAFVAHPVDPAVTLMASSSSDTTVKLWNLINRRYMGQLKDSEHGPVLAVAFRNNNLLASGNEDGTIQLWDVTAQTLKKSLQQHTGAVTAIAFSPDNKVMASAGADQTIKLWDTNKWEVRTLSGHQGRVNALAFSPDGKLLASAGDDAIIYMWETQTGAVSQTLTGHKGAVQTLCFYIDKKTASLNLASGSKDRTVILWQLK